MVKVGLVGFAGGVRGLYSNWNVVSSRTPMLRLLRRSAEECGLRRGVLVVKAVEVTRRELMKLGGPSGPTVPNAQAATTATLQSHNVTTNLGKYWNIASPARRHTYDPNPG
jgi:hypothetical protein